MASFALISLENNYKVDVSEGKVIVGRGPYLKVGFYTQVYFSPSLFCTHVYIERSRFTWKFVCLDNRQTGFQEPCNSRGVG